MKLQVRSSSFVTSILVTVTVGCVLVATQRAAAAAVPVVGLWRFNEGTGTNISDSSGFSNNGTLAGTNGNIPAWVAGQSGFGGALRFTNNGLDHAYVNIPGSSSLQIGQTALKT